MQNGASKKNQNEGATLLAISDYANEKSLSPFSVGWKSPRSLVHTVPHRLLPCKSLFRTPSSCGARLRKNGGRAARWPAYSINAGEIFSGQRFVYTGVERGRLLRPPERVQEFARMQSAGAIGNVRCFLLSFLCFFFLFPSHLLLLCTPRKQVYLPSAIVRGWG